VGSTTKKIVGSGGKGNGGRDVPKKKENGPASRKMKSKKGNPPRKGGGTTWASVPPDPGKKGQTAHTRGEKAFRKGRGGCEPRFPEEINVGPKGVLPKPSLKK